MKPLGAALAAILAFGCLCLTGSAEASGRAAATPSIYAPTWRHETARLHVPHWRNDAPAIAARAAWQGGSSLALAAERYVGSGKFTGLPGAWCADAVSAWLRMTGRPPLANRMAGAALSYGPRGFGAPGDLAVFIGRRGYAYHVGVVVTSFGDRVEVVSGNWGHRVGRAVLPRSRLIFIRT